METASSKRPSRLVSLEAPRSYDLRLPPPVLFGATFLMLFGPRLFGSMMLDLLSLTSVAGFGLLLVTCRGRLPFGTALRLPLLLFGSLFCYSLFVTLIAPVPEFFYPAKVARTIANYLGVFALCVFYLTCYGRDGLARLLEHVFWAVALHGLIMVAGYSSYSFGTFLNWISGYGDIKRFRTTGLTVSYQTLNLVQGMGLLLGVFFIENGLRRRWERFLFPPAFLVTSVSLLLAGRSALFYVMAFTAVVVVFRIRRLLNARLVLVTLVGLGLLIAGYANLDPMVKERFETVTFGEIWEPVEVVLGERDFAGSHSARLARQLSGMYFLPSEPRTLVFGSSLSGRQDIVIPSDVGYVLIIHGLGITGLLLVMLFYLGSAAVNVRLFKISGQLGWLMLYITLGILVLSFKEQVLLTRHAFTLSALFLCAWSIWRPGQSRLMRLSRVAVRKRSQTS